MTTTYANRTCTSCGVRKPQPNMYQRETYVETAKSQTGISGATMFGVFSGDKKSGTQFRNWLFNNGQRTHKRKKKVWLCGVCAGVERPAKKVAVTAPKMPKSTANEDSETFVSADSKSKPNWLLIGFIVLMIAAAIDDCTGKSDNSKKQPTTNAQNSP